MRGTRSRGDEPPHLAGLSLGARTGLKLAAQRNAASLALLGGGLSFPGGAAGRNQGAACGMPSSPPPWMPGCRCATSKKPRHMLTRERRCGMTVPAAAWTGMQHTSSPPISQARHDRASRLESSESRSHAAVTYCDLSANANRRSAPRPRLEGWPPEAARDRTFWLADMSCWAVGSRP